jgi:hypothetical protein
LLLSGIFILAAGLEGSLILVLGPVFGLSSAASAAGSLALARKADDRYALVGSAESRGGTASEGRGKKELGLGD